MNDFDRTCTQQPNIRVGIFSSASLEFYGGGEVTVIELANSLTSLGYDVTVYSDSTSKNIIRKSSAEIERMLNCKHKKVDYLRNKSFLLPSFLFQPLPPISSLQENHVNLLLLYRLPTRKYLKSLGRNSSLKCLFLMHGIVLSQVNSKSFKVILYQMHLKTNFSINSRLYTNKRIFFQVFCDDDQGFLLRHGVKHQNMRVIPTGIDFSKYKVERNDNKFKIVFIGRLDKTQKGISLLLKVVKDIIVPRYQDMEIAIIGSGPALEDIRRIASRGTNIRCFGFVSEEEKIKLLSESNLMIVTSNIEPFSIAAVEGLASGLPIVSTPVSGPKSILNGDNGFGKISSFYKNQFLKAVLNYYSKWKDNKASYYHNKIERRKKSEKLFDLPIMIKSYADMIDEVIAHVDSNDKRSL